MTSAKYNNRKMWLGMLLLLTVLAAIWPMPDRERSIVSASREGGPSRAQHAAIADTTMAKVSFLPLSPEMQSGRHTTVNNLFPAQTWAPPTPPATKQETAPSLPFTFGGRYTEGNDTIVFLMEGNQVHRVRKGETIKEIYRVDKIEPASITLTYLPLGTTQILPTGDLLP